MATVPSIRPDLVDHKTHGPHRLRRTLSPAVAQILADAHARTGLPYRPVAAALGIDYSYWRKLTIGQRAPSLRVAFAIIDLFGFDDETAVKLLDESVVKRDSR
jgi:cyanate lyase